MGLFHPRQMENVVPQGYLKADHSALDDGKIRSLPISSRIRPSLLFPVALLKVAVVLLPWLSRPPPVAPVDSIISAPLLKKIRNN
jgi:hypothetical protein